ncbi:MAG: hypothetical protein AAFN04_12650, partial [Pseudomonadota bacterium]
MRKEKAQSQARARTWLNIDNKRRAILSVSSAMAVAAVLIAPKAHAQSQPPAPAMIRADRAMVAPVEIITAPSLRGPSASINPETVRQPSFKQPQVAPVVIQRVPTVRDDSGQAGINVAASARFNPSQIGFDASLAVDTVNVLADRAIIDWTTFASGAPGQEVTFLGADGRLAFASELFDYTVLNRVITPDFDSVVRLDGTVTSTIAGGEIGGNVWFSSVGGLVVGSNATFNVGSLLLTANAPDLDAFG